MKSKKTSFGYRLFSDLGMLALAVVSLVLLSIDMYFPDLFFEPEYQSWLLVRIDWGICAVFLVEFGIRWFHAKQKLRFVVRNWYDILGMIPLGHPALRGFRLLRAVRIVAVLMRLRRGVDRAFGEGFADGLIRRYKNIFVEIITDAVVLRVLGVVEEVINKGRFGHSIQGVLEQNRHEIHQLVRHNLQRSRTLARVERLPLMSNLTDTILEESTDVIFGVLTDPCFEKTMKELIASVVTSIRVEVAKLDAWDEKITPNNARSMD